MATLLEQYPGKAVKIRFKSAEVDAYTGGISPAIFFAISEAAVAWGVGGADELIVTALRNGQHRLGSRHFKGEGVDIRSKNLPPVVRQSAVERLRLALGQRWKVLLESPGQENEHVHISYVADGGPA